MVQIFECIMLLCFGISWPVSVYKSYTSHSTQGKSLIFMSAILIGYIAGITGKILSGSINYVLLVYMFNFFVVSIDFFLFFVNRKRELSL